MDKGKTLIAEIDIYGLVQGIGFRPFAARLAAELGLGGSVINLGSHVRITASGTAKQLDRLIAGIKAGVPAGGHISLIDETRRELRFGEAAPRGFLIQPSEKAESTGTVASPDIALCGDCLAELFYEGDARHLNPFISCASCGPRFSVMGALPYDRENTSMAEFALCELCAGQYSDLSNRRCHAQTVCCNGCGPEISYTGRNGRGGIDDAVTALMHGGIVALKGIGGYHFACTPFADRTVARLRALKGREAKPFAVMFENINELEKYCEISDGERELLENSARPILLVKRRESALTPGVYGTSPYLGAFLPYAPLQHLILRKTGPLVMTSANLSSLPVIKDDDEMAAFFEEHAELCGVLSHNRRIVSRQDDSVAALFATGLCMVRRARGYVPLPIALPEGGRPTLACGAQEKGTFCLYKAGLAYPSAESGGLESAEAVEAYIESVDLMSGLLGIKSEIVLCDSHPGYASTDYAKGLGPEVVKIQHHHAHIASVMAEHSLSEPIIGVAFDGTGYGPDGTVWGGEFLLVSPEGFERAGHIAPMKLLGGDESVRQGWKSALCLMHQAGMETDDSRAETVAAALEAGVNVITSTSMGRVFDAASALLGICDYSNYDGQCAIELENAAARWLGGGGAAEPLPFETGRGGGRFIADLFPTLRAIKAGLEDGKESDYLAACFHLGVAGMIARMVKLIGRETGIKKAALSGGVFLNRILTERAALLLEEAGFEVFLNHAVSPGDGGISLGQIYAGLMAKKGVLADVHRGGRKDN